MGKERRDCGKLLLFCNLKGIASRPLIIMSDRDEVVRDLDLLAALSAVVPLVAEEQGGARQAVKLTYTDDFDFVQCVLRGLLLVHAANAAPSSQTAPEVPVMRRPNFICDLSSRSTEAGSGMPSKEWAPLYLIVQAFVIDKCGAHYGAWKFRRDIVTSPDLFLMCAVEAAQVPVPSQPLPTAPHNWKSRYATDRVEVVGGFGIRDYIFKDLHEFSILSTGGQSLKDTSRVSDEDGKESDSFETIDSSEEESRGERQRKRHSALCAVLPSVLGGDFASDGEYCPWRAVAWELGQCRSFALMCHKNFQVWHHRRELITFGSTTGGTYKGAIPFSAIDERVLCDEVLEEDSKNYHVWSHRCWFVSAFKELHSVDVASMVEGSIPCSLKAGDPAVAQHTTESDDEYMNEIRKNAADTSVKSFAAGALVVGGLANEFAYSSRLIEKDVFNNSAWSYRMLLLRQFIVEGSFMVSIKTAIESGSSTEEVERLCTTLFANVLSEEITFAIQWASKEVCNECPFTYARGVAAIAKGCILSALTWTETAPKTQRNLLKVFLQVFASSAAPESEKFGQNRLVASLPALYVHHQFARAVLPRALVVSEQAQDPNMPYGKRTAFVRNNTHQCLAGMFHSAFDAHSSYYQIAGVAQSTSPSLPMGDVDGDAPPKISALVVTSGIPMSSTNTPVHTWIKESLPATKMANLLKDARLGLWGKDNLGSWGMYFSEHLRKVSEGVVVEMLDAWKGDSAAQLPSGTDLVDWVYCHLTCLALGRLLMRQDTIRFKYWKSQIHDLLHFRMLV